MVVPRPAWTDWSIFGLLPPHPKQRASGRHEFAIVVGKRKDSPCPACSWPCLFHLNPWGRGFRTIKTGGGGRDGRPCFLPPCPRRRLPRSCSCRLPTGGWFAGGSHPLNAEKARFGRRAVDVLRPKKLRNNVSKIPSHSVNSSLPAQYSSHFITWRSCNLPWFLWCPSHPWRSQLYLSSSCPCHPEFLALAQTKRSRRRTSA